MDLEEITKLLDLVNSSNVEEFELESEGFKIKIKKGKVIAVSDPAVNEIIKTNESLPASKTESEDEFDESKHFIIKSPMVGTFYRAPAPDADPYVEMGSIVNPNTVVCIVEAMKLMNEIKAETNGKIIKILVENAHPVEYGQDLFIVELV